MKRALVLVALFVSGVAYAQPAGSDATAGKKDHPPAETAPAQGTAVDKGQAQGTGPQGAEAAPSTLPGSGGAAGVPADGSAAAGSAAAPAAAGSAAAPAAAGSAAAAPAAGAGSAAATGAPKAEAWYDVLAHKPIDEYGNFWMPAAENEAAADSDIMYYSVLGLSIFFFVAIAICVIYFTIKYRHRPGHKAEPSAAHNDALEVTWTVIPTIIVVFLFWFGWRSYIHVVTPPNKAVEINVLAWRWNWQFTHANGVTDSDLHIPVNTPVRLVMTSKDVLHSFYAPAFRVKQDVVPRRYTYAWLLAKHPGTFRLTCAEYCGTSHAQMACHKTDANGVCLERAVVVVHEPGKYEQYLADKANENSKPSAELGKALYEKKGCVACHTIDGTPRVGPTFAQKDWGKTITLNSGTVKMDETYVRESMMSPQAKARPGYPPSMPSFEGQLKENEILSLIAFIKSLKE